MFYLESVLLEKKGKELKKKNRKRTHENWLKTGKKYYWKIFESKALKTFFNKEFQIFKLKKKNIYKFLGEMVCDCLCGRERIQDKFDRKKG